MKNLIIARRYAKALLLIGKENGQAESYREEMEHFSALMKATGPLQDAVSNPLYESSGRRNVLSTVLQRLGVSEVMEAFLLLLFDKSRLGFIHHINDVYNKLVDDLNGIAVASLVSAVELHAEVIDKIREVLSKRTGRQIILEVKQDTSLIGGVVTQIGDLVLDGSVKTQLRNMRETLKRGDSV